MPVYGAFSYSTLGMMAQSDTMSVIGGNIANINTGGYKETENRFKTVLSDTISNQSDIGGVRTVGVQHIGRPGNITSSARELDIAINGSGFFILNTEIDGSGDMFYTRDGSLYQKMVDTTTKESYLVDKNGYYVMGWQADTDGTIDTSQSLAAMRIDPGSFTAQGQATTSVEMDVNVPSTAATDDKETYRLEVFDANFDKQSIDVNFTKNATTNTWDVSVGYPGPPTAQVDTVTLAGTPGEAGDTYSVTIGSNTVTYTTTGGEASLNAIRDALVAKINADTSVNTTITAAAGGAGQITLTAQTAGSAFTTTVSATNGGATADNTATNATTTANNTGLVTTASQSLTFSNKGRASGTTSLDYTLSWANGTTSTITLDLAKATQFSGPFSTYNVVKNGLGTADMSSIQFDSLGHVVGRFDDGTLRNVFKLGLGTFSNPDALQKHNGNVFSETPESGSANTTEAMDNGFAFFSPNALEGSNVDLADQFSKMIMTQNAYNSSATVFRTVDEMLTTARDLK